jgi:hypothetical protein
MSDDKMIIGEREGRKNKNIVFFVRLVLLNKGNDEDQIIFGRIAVGDFAAYCVCSGNSLPGTFG